MNSKDHSENTDEFNSLRTYFSQEITKKSDDSNSKMNEMKSEMNEIRKEIK